MLLFKAICRALQLHVSNAFIFHIFQAISQLDSQLCFWFYFFKGVLKETSETMFWEKSFNSSRDSVWSYKAFVCLLWTTFMVLFASYGANSHPFLYHRKLCAWMFCLTSAAFHESNRIRWGQNDMMVWQTLIFLEQTMALWRAHIPIVMKAWNSTDRECWMHVFSSVWCYRGGQWSVDACSRLYGLTIRPCLLNEGGERRRGRLNEEKIQKPEQNKTYSTRMHYIDQKWQ